MIRYEVRLDDLYIDDEKIKVNNKVLSKDSIIVIDMTMVDEFIFNNKLMYTMMELHVAKRIRIHQLIVIGESKHNVKVCLNLKSDFIYSIWTEIIPPLNPNNFTTSLVKGRFSYPYMIVDNCYIPPSKDIVYIVDDYEKGIVRILPIDECREELSSLNSLFPYMI